MQLQLKLLQLRTKAPTAKKLNRTQQHPPGWCLRWLTDLFSSKWRAYILGSRGSSLPAISWRCLVLFMLVYLSRGRGISPVFLNFFLNLRTSNPDGVGKQTLRVPQLPGSHSPPTSSRTRKRSRYWKAAVAADKNHVTQSCVLHIHILSEANVCRAPYSVTDCPRNCKSTRE